MATNSANISDLQAIKNTLAVAMEITSYIRDNLEEYHFLEPDMEGVWGLGMLTREMFLWLLVGYVDLSGLVRELDSALSGDTFGDYISTGR